MEQGRGREKAGGKKTPLPKKGEGESDGRASYGHWRRVRAHNRRRSVSEVRREAGVVGHVDALREVRNKLSEVGFLMEILTKSGWREVEASETRSKGLVVHRRIDNGLWAITHRWSGTGVAARFPSKEAALLTAAAMAPVLPWDAGEIVLAFQFYRLPMVIQKWLRSFQVTA
jgi:hypothetical protein